MRDILRKIFSPILVPFESGDDPVIYKASHRTILIAVGALFLLLSGVSTVSSIVTQQLGGIFPAVIFFGAGLVAEVVGLLGNDRAVAKIWGSRR